METVRSASWGQPPPVEFQRGHLENIRFHKVFQRGPCGIELGIEGPPPTSQGLAQAVTVKSFILTLFHKGFGETVIFPKKQ